MTTPSESEVKAEGGQSGSGSTNSTSAVPAYMNFSVGLPKFSGDSGLFERFVDDFSIFARLQRWDDDRKRDVFPLCLSGIARNAYDSLSSGQKAEFDLTVAGLKSPFAGRTPIDCHMSLTSLRYDPSEPLDAFVIKLRRLVARAFPGQAQDGLMFNHFLMSLPDDYRVQVVAAGITSFEAAVTKVRRVRAGKRTQAIRVRSSCFGCLATLQKRHLESKVSCHFDGAAGGSWVRCGFCCLFERPKHVFRIFFRVFGCWKRCDLPQGAAIEFSFFLSRNNGNSGECVKPQLFMRRL